MLDATHTHPPLKMTSPANPSSPLALGGISTTQAVFSVLQSLVLQRDCGTQRSLLVAERGPGRAANQGGGQAFAFVSMPFSTPCTGCVRSSLTSQGHLNVLDTFHRALRWEFVKGTPFSIPFLSVCWSTTHSSCFPKLFFSLRGRCPFGYTSLFVVLKML